MELAENDELGAGNCSVVWNVADKAVVQPVTDIELPTSLDLLPIRRVGTYCDAPNTIAMFPAVRDGYVLMLTVESRLELAWLQHLACDPRVSGLYTQPCLLLWTHEEGKAWRVPDLAAVIDGRLVFFDVKHSVRLEEPWTQMAFKLTARSLADAGVPYEVLSEMSAQRAHNLQLLSRYRWWNPALAEATAAVRDARPHTAAGLIRIIADLQSSGKKLRDESAVLEPDALGVGQAVLFHLLATGQCSADLDAPLRVVTGLTWPEQADSGGAQ
ncbi:hypothetical protein GCM10022237_46140 [Nocardioides ginsengisoli]|uniref:TnsA-like heteromeric transposase endonuclease subunit n=1 Tax=Nocardioides ginsengisoli TaxID=363868 RepID=A0ABW3W8T1_9ACTN